MNKGADASTAGDKRVGGTKGGVGKAWIVLAFSSWDPQLEV